MGTDSVLAFSERELEAPFSTLLRTGLALELLNFSGASPSWVVENTARGGPTAGQWTQPDIVLACVRNYRSRAVPELELFGFELKTETGFDISSVHQALAHTRYVHFSHLVVHCPSDEEWDNRLAEVRRHAQQLGVGLIRMKRVEPTAACDIALFSERFNPAPHFVDGFLEDRLPHLLDWVAEQLGKEC